MAEEIKQITGTGVPLLLDDIDTDRVIPARFLRCVTFDGLGAHVFEDDRKQAANHAFDDARFENGTVLVVGRNFGCGSSREHAPQALMRWGIQAIVGESFAEIFFGNCTSLGIPAVCLNRDELERLSAAIQNDPSLEIMVDLVGREVRYGDTSAACTIPESARKALVSGQWDFLSQLLEGETQVRETASKIPYVSGFPA